MFIRFLKPLSFLPALFMMYLIFSFSSQDGTTSSQLSYEVSYTIVDVGNTVLDAGLETAQIQSWAIRINGAVRKLAHVTEYFLLAIAMSFPLYVYGLRGLALMLLAGLLCVAFAGSDEFHQSMVEGRGPGVRDVFIDSVGIFCGILFTRFIGWIGRKTIFHPRKKAKKKMQATQKSLDPFDSIDSFDDFDSESCSQPNVDRLSEDMSLKKLIHDIKSNS